MSLADFERAVLALYSDAGFRRRLRRAPRRELAAFDLTAHERRALTELARRARELAVFGESLGHKAFARSWGAFPAISTLCAASRNAFRALFLARYDFRRREPDEVLEYFAEFLGAVWDEHLLELPDGFDDLLKYDRLWLRASRGTAGNSASPGAAGSRRRLWYVVAPGVIVSDFTHDVPAALATPTKTDIPVSPCTLAFASDSAGGATVFRLTPALVAVLERARQPARFDDLVAASAAAVGLQPVPNEFRVACRAAIEELSRGRLLVTMADHASDRSGGRNSATR